MNSRQRFLAAMRFEKVGRLPLTEFLGFDEATVRRWRSEGLPAEQDPFEFFGLEHCHMLPVVLEHFPPFKREVIEEGEDYVVVVTETGRIEKLKKQGYMVPQVLKYPVSTPAEWYQYKQGLTFSEQRLPADWPKTAKCLEERDYPLYLYMRGGFYGQPRTLLGDEHLCLAFYDYPEMIDDMLGFWTDFVMECWTPVLKTVDIDFVIIWEDMSYRGGSMISPSMFRRFITPHLQRFTKFLKDMGVDIILVDTDGDCTELIPLFIEGGVTGMFPFEVQCGMDVVEVAKQYPDLQIIGGIDKTAVARGGADIKGEIEKRVVPLLDRGGFIPSFDHLGPPTGSLANYTEYIDQLRSALGC